MIKKDCFFLICSTIISNNLQLKGASFWFLSLVENGYTMISMNLKLPMISMNLNLASVIKFNVQERWLGLKVCVWWRSVEALRIDVLMIHVNWVCHPCVTPYVTDHWCLYLWLMMMLLSWVFVPHWVSQSCNSCLRPTLARVRPELHTLRSLHSRVKTQVPQQKSIEIPLSRTKENPQCNPLKRTLKSDHLLKGSLILIDIIFKTFI